MQERRDAGKEGCRKEECRKVGMQERRVAGKDGCRKGGVQERTNARKDGVQERTSFCVIIVLCNSHEQLPFSYKI